MKYDLTREPTRGAQRTLDDFRQALFLALAQKPFEDIAVNELCSSANYPRATFYNYFDDKFDLLQYGWIWLAQQAHLEDYPLVPRSQAIYVFFDRIFDFTQAHMELIRRVLLYNPDTGYMFSSFRNFMNDQVRALFQDCGAAGEYKIDPALIASHYSNTMLLVWQWCSLKRDSCTKEQAHTYLRYLLGGL